VPKASSLPAKLNLSSTKATVSASASGTIMVGGTKDTIQVNQLLTPAEDVALSQMLATGKQFLTLGGSGSAVGGRLWLTSSLSQGLTNLVIPKGVTVVDSFAGSSTLQLSGDVTNSGTFYLYSGNPAYSSITLAANNIFNLQGGLLSSVLPTGLASRLGLSGSSFNLNLVAANTLSNAGMISSSGNLSLMVAKAIINTSSGNMPATMQAAGNINLVSNNVTNSGLVNALAGNITVSSPSASNITFNNNGGTLQALAGNINVRDASFTGNYNFNLSGGNLLSQQLNIYSGLGTVSVAADNITGVVNVDAGQAHVQASTPNLLLGNMQLSGDPTFYNAAGDITIEENLAFAGQDLAIVASGNIYSGPGADQITTSSDSFGQSGGNITLIAGAAFTPISGSSLPVPPNSGGDTTTKLIVTGGSAGGGSIDLTGASVANGVPINSINSSNSIDGSGGNVTMVAFAGTTSGSGTINLPTASSITSSGSSGSGGNVTLIAGAISGTSINVGSISAGTGVVSINTATPTIIAGDGTISILNGTIQPTSGIFAAGTMMPGAAILNGIITAAAVNVAAGSISQKSAITLQSTGGYVNLFALSGGVTIGGTITTDGGNLNVIASSNIVTASGASAIGTGLSGGSDGNGGAVLMISGASSSYVGSSFANGTLTITAASSSGGYIDLTGGTGNGTAGTTPITSLTTSGTEGNGGNITMVAYAGGGTNTGTIILPSIAATANGAEVGGNVTLIAGATSGTSMNASGFNASVTSGNGGSVLISAATPVIQGGSGNISIANGAVSSASGSFAAGASQQAAINLNGSITGNNVTINNSTSGRGDSITVSGAITAVSSVSVAAGGSITVSAPVSVSSSSGSLSLTSDSGFISSSTSNDTISAASVTINAPAGGDITLGTGTSEITLTQGINPSSLFISTTLLSSFAVNAGNNNIIVSAPISIGTGSSSSLTLTSTGGNSGGNIYGLVPGDTVSAGKVTINAEGAGDVTLGESGSAVSLGQGAVNTLYISTNSLSSLAVDAGINNIIVASSLSVGSGSSGSLTLTSTGGNIYSAGSASGNTLSAGTVTINAEGAGNVTLNTGTSTITLGQGTNPNLLYISTTSLSTFSVDAGSNSISVTAPIVVGTGSSGSLTLTSTGGTISSAASADTVNAGSVAINPQGSGAVSLSLNGASISLGQGGDTLYITTPSMSSFSVNGGSNAVTASAITIPASSLQLVTTGSLTMSGNFASTTLRLQAAQVLSSGPLTLVASSNMTIIGSINTSSAAGNGGNITLISGANFTMSGTGSTSTLTVTGGTTAGGYINISASSSSTTPITINSSSTVGNGGSLTLVAFTGTSAPGANAGTITLPTTSTIETGGAAGMTDGTVTVIAGAASGSAVILGSIDATTTAASGSGKGSNATVLSSTPVANKVTFSNGVMSGSFTGGTEQSGNIAISGNVSLDGNFLSVTSNGSFDLSSIGSATSYALTAGGTVEIGAGTMTIGGTTGTVFTSLGAISAGTGIELEAAGNLTTNGNVVSTSGNILLATTKTASGANSNGSITIGGNVVALGTVNVEANGSGSVSGPNKVVGTISANTGAGDAAWQFLLGGIVDKIGSTSFLYVPDYTLGVVAVINLSTNQQVAQIALGGTPTSSTIKPQGVALSPDGSTLYVADYGTDSVSVINTSTNTLTTTIALNSGNGAETLYVSQNGATKGTIYVLSDNATGFGGAGAGTGTFSVITNSQGTYSVANIPLIDPTTQAAGTNFEQTGGVVVNPTGTIAYVTESGTKNVFVMNLSTNKVSQVISLSQFGPSGETGLESPYFLAIDPNGQYLYVAESYSNGSNTIIGGIAQIDVQPGTAKYNQLLSTTGVQFGSDYFPQGISVNPTSLELMAQTTYSNPFTVQEVLTGELFQAFATNSIAGVGNGSDGFGSSGFSALVTNNGVPNEVTYSSNTLNLTPTVPGTSTPVEGNTVSIVEKPTIQGSTVNLSSQTGGIIVNYNTNGGTMSVTTDSYIVVGNVGALPSKVGTSGTDSSVFELGSVGPLTLTGVVYSPELNIQTTANNASITLTNNVYCGNGSAIFSVNGSGSLIQTTGAIIGVGATAPTFANTSGYAGSSMTFNAVTGNIGSAATPLVIETSELSAVSSGNVYIKNYNPGETVPAESPNNLGPTATATWVTTLGAMAAGGALQLTNVGSLDLTGPVSAATVQMTTSLPTSKVAPTENIVIGSAASLMATTSAQLTAAGTGTITESGSSVLTAPVLALSAASIGSSTSNIDVSTSNGGNAGTLTLTTTGSAFVNDSSAVNVSAPGVTGTFSLTAAGTITTTGAITGSTIDMTASGSGSNITLSSALGSSATKTISLDVTGNGNITETGTNKITGGSGSSLTLSVGTGNIGVSPSSLLVTSVANLTVDGTGSSQAFISNGVALTLNASSLGSSLQLNNTGILTVAGNVTAPTMTLQSTGNITTTGSGVLTAAAGLTLTSTGTTSTIGSSATNLAINAAALTISSAGSVYVNDSQSLTLHNASAGSTFSLNDNGTLTTTLLVSAKSIYLGASSIVLGGNLGTAATTSTNLYAGNGTISAGGTLSIYGLTSFYSGSGETLSVETGGTAGVAFATFSGASTNAILTLPTMLATGASLSVQAGTVNLIGNIGLASGTTYKTVVLLATGATGTVSDTNPYNIYAASLSFNSPGTATLTLASNSTAGVGYYSLNGSTLTLPSKVTTGGTLSVSAAGLDLTTAIGQSATAYSSVSLSANTTGITGNEFIYTTSLSVNLPSTITLSVTDPTGPTAVTYYNIDGSTNTVTLPTKVASTTTLSASAGSIDLTGNIGQSAGLFASVSLTASGTGTVSDSAPLSIYSTSLNLASPGTTLTLGNSAANGFYSLNGSALTLPTKLGTGASLSVVAQSISLSNTVGLSSGTSYSSVALNAIGGDITGNTFTIYGTSLALNTNGGNIDGTSNTANLLTKASSLYIQAGTGTALVQDSLAATLDYGSAAVFTFTDTASAGGITYLGSIGSVSGQTTLIAGGSGSISTTSANASILGSTVVLQSASGSIGSSASNINTDAGTLTATTGGTGNVYINNGSAVSLGTTSKAGGTFSLTNVGDLMTGAVTATNVILQTTSNGTITLGGSVGTSGTGTTTTLTATGSGSITANGNTDVVIGSTVTLNTSGGSMDASGATPLQIQASSLFVNTASGTALLNNASAVNLKGATGVGGGLTLTASGTITVSGAVNATNVTLKANSGSNGSIAYGATIGIFGSSGAIDLSANGSGSITATTNTANVYGENIALGTTAFTGAGLGTGNIGTSTANIITGVTPGVTPDGTLSSNTSGSGKTYINNITAGTVIDNITYSITLGPSSSGTTFSLTNGGTLTLGSITTGTPSTLGVSTNSISVVIAGGALTVANNAVITANGGSVTLENANTSNGTILIGNTSASGVNITAASSVQGSGQVYVVIGAPPATPTRGTAPATVVPIGSLSVFYGASGITTPDSGTITLTGTGSGTGNNIIFNGTSTDATITVHSGTSITATNIDYKDQPQDSGSRDLIVDTGDSADEF
jgi:YVTN family beta-propeller protein